MTCGLDLARGPVPASGSSELTTPAPTALSIQLELPAPLPAPLLVPLLI